MDPATDPLDPPTIPDARERGRLRAASRVARLSSAAERSEARLVRSADLASMTRALLGDRPLPLPPDPLRS